MTDTAAIRKALEPRVSCKGSPTNEGVGLTLVTGLVRRIKGWLMILRFEQAWLQRTSFCRKLHATKAL